VKIKLTVCAHKLSKGRPWSDNDLLMLIRIPREMLPELSEFLGRPLDELERKYEMLQTSFKRLYMAKAKRYMKIGYEPDEAFEKLASEEEIDIERICAMEKALAREYSRVIRKST